ncbi:MAG: DUF927 domain-containing protein [Deltaproteobacteria bacterium]|nr:DUF927 domain-containing protein [Deltaproteobacteria bacterium]
MRETEISFYERVTNPNSYKKITIAEFLEGVKSGTWKAEVVAVRALPTKEKRKAYKEKHLPCVTISGLFGKGRSIKNLTQHSGFICIDIDDLTSEELKTLLNKFRKDKYIYAAFYSASSTGLAVIIKINPERHKESFLALEKYFNSEKTYNVKIDKSCKDVSRLRFVSYSPELHINLNALEFDLLLNKDPLSPKKKPSFIDIGDTFAQIEYVVRQLEEKKLVLGCQGWPSWNAIGFALANECGEGGRDLFHRISAVSPKYNAEYTEKTYTGLLKSDKETGLDTDREKITIGTFFMLAKKAGVNINSPVRKSKQPKTKISDCGPVYILETRVKDEIDKKCDGTVIALPTGLFGKGGAIGEGKSFLEELRTYNWEDAKVFIGVNAEHWGTQKVRTLLYDSAFSLLSLNADVKVLDFKSGEKLLWSEKEKNAKGLLNFTCEDHTDEIIKGVAHADFKDTQFDQIIKKLSRKLNVNVGTFKEAVKKEQQKTNQEKAVPTNQDKPYFLEDGYVWQYKQYKGRHFSEKIANFTAKIVTEILRDNGLEQKRCYVIEGKLNGTKSLGRIEILASTYAKMQWVSDFGAEAIIEPGNAAKDLVRHYIQKNSKPEKRTIHTHTGWGEGDNNNPYYLSGNGALGADNWQVELPLELKRYALPLTVENEREAIEASLSFLEIGKEKVTYLLFMLMYLSPLTTILEPIPNFSGYLYGGTGTLKTTLAILVLSHFGNFNTASNLANFEDTANSVEKKAFILKDTLNVLDDYHPSAQKHEAWKKENIAQRLIRAYGNRTGKGRMNSNCEERVRYSPRGMLLVTGEILVGVSSTLTRAMVVDIFKGDINKEKLTILQGKSHLLPHAMASFIYWLRGNIKEIQDNFPSEFKNLRAKACGEHGKYPDQVAFLFYALRVVLSWVTEKGVLSKSEAEKIADKAWDILNDSVSRQTQILKEGDPIQKFKDILNTGLEQKMVRLESKHTSTQDTGCHGTSEGDLIGYQDDTYYYLNPTAVWKFASTYGGPNEHFPGTKNSLFLALGEAGLIRKNGTENTVIVTIRNKSRRVIQLYRSTLEESADHPDE